VIAGAEVGVDQRRRRAELVRRAPERVARLAEEQAVGGRDAVGMGRHLALEDMDVAAGKEIAQMVVGPAVAEADLEDRAGHGVDGDLRKFRQSRCACMRAMKLSSGSWTDDVRRLCWPVASTQLLVGRPPRDAPARASSRSPCSGSR
jgi:hypothetical protein